MATSTDAAASHSSTSITGRALATAQVIVLMIELMSLPLVLDYEYLVHVLL
jgi:hypothetical protein